MDSDSSNRLANTFASVQVNGQQLSVADVHLLVIATKHMIIDCEGDLAEELGDHAAPLARLRSRLIEDGLPHDKEAARREKTLAKDADIAKAVRGLSILVFFSSLALLWVLVKAVSAL